MSLKQLKYLLDVSDCESNLFFDDILSSKNDQTNIDETTVRDFLQTLNSDIEKCGATVRWKYTCNILYCLGSEARDNTNALCSVKDENIVKHALEFVISLGVIPSMIPGIGTPLNKRSKYADRLTMEEVGSLEKYHRLTVCTNVFHILWSVEQMRKVIFTYYLSDYLAALIQLSFAPLKKPSGEIITPEIWTQLQCDRKKYNIIFKNVVTTTYQPKVIRELMMIQASTNPKPPAFLKKTLSAELSERLMAKGGLDNLVKCFIDNSDFDSGEQWRSIDIISRLVSINHTANFIENICSQINEALDSSTNAVVYAACINNLCDTNPANEFVVAMRKNLFHPFKIDTLTNGRQAPGILLLSPSEIESRISIIYNCYTLRNMTNLNWSFLSASTYSLFQIFLKMKHDNPQRLSLADLISRFLMTLNTSDFNSHLDCIFLGLSNKTKLELYCDFDESNLGTQIKNASEIYDHPIELVLHGINELLRISKSKTLAMLIFKYALETLCYFEDSATAPLADLLDFEVEMPNLLNWHSSCHIILLKLLENLSSSEEIIQSLTTDPTCIVTFVQSLLQKIARPKSSNEDCLIIALVLLTTVLSASKEIETVKKSFEPIREQMVAIGKITNRSEIKLLANECLNLVSETDETSTKSALSKLEAALEHLYDPLLPVRAHGLMEIVKLFEAKDSETITKRHYIMCIFQENLRNEDSYMYLTAINGLAALANACTEDVLEILTNEYLSTNDKRIASSGEVQTSVEIRMKIGEVLVRVTKALGEMAPIHKAALLNTFLISCKDSDFLIRASALSNLAEVSRVLSYKLGNIVHEILLCVSSVIETDKSPECRRAAVMVTSSLLKGLGRDALIFLKEALLPLYRTLKRIYSDHNEEDIIRLHAQLALEELNSCIKDALLPELKMEKRIFVLDK